MTPAISKVPPLIVMISWVKVRLLEKLDKMLVLVHASVDLSSNGTDSRVKASETHSNFCFGTCDKQPMMVKKRLCLVAKDWACIHRKSYI